MLAFSISVAAFFLILWLLQDGFEESPAAKAGLSASLVMIAAVLIRFFIIRRLRERVMTERRLDQNLRAVANMASYKAANKFTLEQNAALIRQIKEKSNAANVLGKLAAAHREVFELCDSYIELVTSEIPQTSPGSPRLGAFLKGRIYADEVGRKHLLSSVEIELKQFMNEAGETADLDIKLKLLQNASNKVNRALGRYPTESQLLDSSKVLNSAVITAKVTDMVQRADRAEFDNDKELSLQIYQDALFYISRNSDEEGMSEIENIVSESINRLTESREDIRI